MPRPTDTPPAFAAPRLAASMIPGPPPVMTVMPLPGELARQVLRGSAYVGSSGRSRRAEDAHRRHPSAASESKPSTNSPMMRSARQASRIEKASVGIRRRAAGACDPPSACRAVGAPGSPVRRGQPRRYLHGRRIDAWQLKSITRNPDLWKAFCVCVDLLAQFREIHIGYAERYIFRQHQSHASNPTAVGTGGTPFMPYLNKHLEETKRFVQD